MSRFASIAGLRPGRRAAFILAGVVSLCVLLIVLLLGTGPGLALVALIAGRMASSEGQEVRIEQVSGVLTGNLRVGSVKVSDGGGPWLEIFGAAMDWRPTALLSGTLAIDRLAVARIAMARPPQPAGADDGDAGGRLPAIRLSLKELSVGEIALAQPVLGESARLAVSGSAELDDDPARVLVDLDVRRLDGTPGEVSLRGAFSPGSNLLDVDVKASEPAGGAIARLLKLPGLPSVDLEVAGSGPLEDWSGTARVLLDGREELAGMAAIAGGTAGRRITARLKGRLGVFVPAHVTPLVAGDTTIDLDLTHAPDRIRLDRLALRSATAAIDATGTYAPDQQQVDAEIAASIGAAGTELRFTLADGMPVTLGHTVLRARFAGDPAKGGWRVRGEVASLATPGGRLETVRLEASGTGADLTGRTVPFTASVTAGDVALTDASGADFVHGPSQVTASGAWRDDALLLDQAEMRSGFGDLALFGQASGDFRTLAGSLKGSLRNTRNAEIGKLLAGEPAAFSAEVERTGDTYTVSGLSIEAKGMALEGEARLAGKTVSASGRVERIDLASVDPRMAGSVNAEFSAAGTLVEPEITLRLTGEGVSLLGRPLSEPVLAFKGTLSGSKPSGELTLSGSLDGRQVSAAARLVARETGPSRAEKVTLKVGRATISGDISLGAGSVPEGRFSIDVPDLAEIAPLLLQDGLAGGISGTVLLEDRGGRQGLRIALASPSLRLDDTALEDLRIEASAADLTGDITVDGSATAGRLRAGALTLEKLAAKAESAAGTTRFAADATLEGQPARLAGTLMPGPAGLEIVLDEASARYRGVPARLKAPARISVAAGKARLEDIRLGISDGEVKISGEAGDVLNLKLRLASVPAAAANGFATGAGLAGTLSGDADISGRPADPAVRFKATWRGASAAQLRELGVPALNVSASGQFGGGALEISSDISGAGANLKLAGMVHLKPSPLLDLTVKGGIPLGLAQGPLARSGLRLSGGAKLDIAVRGAPEAPEVTGSVLGSDILFVETGSGIAVRGIEATIELAGKQARITRFAGAIGEDGRLEVTGSVGLDPAAGHEANLAIRLSNARYSDSRTVTAVLDGDLKLTGPLLATPQLGGRVSVQRADITIPNRLPESFAALDVDHVNAPEPVRGQTEALKERSAAGAGGNAPVTFDLEVSAPRRIYIRGRGMNAELGGRIRLTGSPASPGAVGSFDLIKGQFDILTRRLAFSRGSISLTGSLDPALDFAAQNSSGGVTTIVEISGRASDPKFAFSSVPALPQDEVMARLFFDKSIASLSPVQLAQLANAVATLSGVSGGGGVLERIRGLLGVDTLDITTGPDGKDPKVSAGRYITDKAYVGVKQGTDLGSSSVTTNIDLSDTIKLKGEIDAQGKTKAGIFLERDY